MTRDEQSLGSGKRALWLFGAAALVLNFLYQYSLRALSNRNADVGRFTFVHWRILGYAVPFLLCLVLAFFFRHRLQPLAIGRGVAIVMLIGVFIFLGQIFWAAACPWLEECI